MLELLFKRKVKASETTESRILLSNIAESLYRHNVLEIVSHSDEHLEFRVRNSEHFLATILLVDGSAKLYKLNYGGKKRTAAIMSCIDRKNPEEIIVGILTEGINYIDTISKNDVIIQDILRDVRAIYLPKA